MARDNGGETMKTARVPCNFCEFCRYERTPQEQEQDNEAVSMESELKRLRLLTRRITGKDLDGVSLPELELLESQLKNVRQIVQNQRTQVRQEEFERLRNQMKQAASEVGIKRGPLVPCNFSGISSEERPQKQDDEAPTPVTALQRAYERRLTEPMESEIERLCLLNERMNGRKLEGMTLFELYILEGQLSESMLRILNMRSDRKAEHKERRLEEESINLLEEMVKNARVLCYFCCSNSRYEQTPQGQEHEALSMESELKRLRLLTRRMTGRDLDGLSFPELELLESRLRHVRQIVKNQRTQVEQEDGEKLQKKQAANEVGIGRVPLVPCSFSGSSSGERPQKHEDEPPLPLSAAQREFERLWLLNERMNGRKLEGMAPLELRRLEGQIAVSTNRIMAQKLEPGTEERARRFKEESISLLVEQDILNEEARCLLAKAREREREREMDRYRDMLLRFGRRRRHTRLSVSRKLIRFLKRHHRKSRSALRV